MDEVGTGLLIKQLFIGSLVIAGTVAIHAEMLRLMTNFSPRLMQFARAKFRRFADTGFIMTGVLFIMFAHTLEVWLWACVLMATGETLSRKIKPRALSWRRSDGVPCTRMGSRRIWCRSRMATT